MARPTRLPFAGSGDYDYLCDSFLHQGEFVCLALRRDGGVVFINEAVTELLGYEPTDLVGTNVAGLIHPDDLERVVMLLTTAEHGQTIRGITTFRVRHADGSWLSLEVFSVPVSDGAEEYVGAYVRQSHPQVIMQRILALLLSGFTREEILRPVCDMISWRELGSQFAISWQDELGFHQVSTGIGPGLGGGDGRKDTPWDVARRAHHLGRIDGVTSDLPEELAEIATAAGLAMFRIQPVTWSGRYPPAMITIWTTGGRITPSVHSYGMDVAENLVELILGWTEQVADLNVASNTDPLTELANRRTFFAALSDHDCGGALVYCDLDLFKPVNDNFGHAAGDTLLHLVARRLESCVREGDLIARLGGDEFAIICYGASEVEAAYVADRIHHAVERPFIVDGHRIEIGVSIGIASDPDHLTSDTLARADRELYEVKERKQAGRPVVPGR